MLLWLLAILCFSAAVLIGLFLGWQRTLASALALVNAGWVPALEARVPAPLRDTVLTPILGMPAWGAASAVGVIFLLASALRPGRG